LARNGRGGDRKDSTMRELLTTLIFAAGIGQFLVLIASAQVPLRLNWRDSLASLPKLHRQLYWIYGGYVVLAIIGQGPVNLLCSAELASRSALARGDCGYIAVFWGVRLCLQAVLDVKEHLTAWWLTAGYHLLSALCSSP
jgi:hypothetical protein